jgi:hypothetical protein
MITLKPVKDNTFGRGYVPLAPTLRYLDRLADGFRSERIVDHKVLVDDDCHVLTTKRFDIMDPDLKTMQRLGLMRVRNDGDGVTMFYFYVGKRPT